MQRWRDCGAGNRGNSLAARGSSPKAFFGIRGFGSIYYLAYGLNHMDGIDGARLWGIVGLIILFSVILHGLTVTPVMRRLDRERGVDPDAEANNA